MERSIVKTQCDQKNVSTINSDLSYEIIRQCSHYGIMDFCICPGGRNASLIDCLDVCYQQSELYFFNDERSASFFALGLSKRKNRPIAIITTSGTAVGELLPALMEAYYSRLPILAITADRPKKYRGTGAPQSAEQKNIFGIYCPFFQEIENITDINLVEWNAIEPGHLNICLEESYKHDFNDKITVQAEKFKKKKNTNQYSYEEIIKFLRKNSFPLIIVGGLLKKDRESVIHFLEHLKIPVYCEAISGIREDKRLAHLLLRCPNLIQKLAHISGYQIDSVLRIGSIPTLRFWRDLEYLSLNVFSLSHLPFSGVSGGRVYTVDLHDFLTQFPKEIEVKNTPQNFLLLDQSCYNEINSLFDSNPNAEQTFIHHLSKHIPKDSQIFLGNSLSIRHWDSYATIEDKNFEIFANRGVNGIDGEISTFLGLCDPSKSNWAIIGDLTAIYDLSAPWILSQLDAKKISIVIMNNNGGKIFESLFKNKKIQNNHSFSFKAFSEMWRMHYETFTTSNFKLLSDDIEPRVIECLPDNKASLNFTMGLK